MSSLQNDSKSDRESEAQLKSSKDTSEARKGSNPSALGGLLPILGGSPLGELVNRAIGHARRYAESQRQSGTESSSDTPSNTTSSFHTATPVAASQTFSVKNDSFLKALAVLSADSYGKIALELPDGCEFCEEHKTTSGLHAKLYRLNKGQYVCAFAGTRSRRDLLEDVIQCIGLSSQFEDALKFARDIAKRYSTNVIFTGHSQGGGEATYCAYSLGCKAYTFNPAGLSLFTSWKIPQTSIKKAEVHSYIFGYDILNIFQTGLSAKYPLLDIGPDGNVHHVTDYKPQKISISHFHGMEGILSYFGLLS